MEIGFTDHRNENGLHIKLREAYGCHLGFGQGHVCFRCLPPDVLHGIYSRKLIWGACLLCRMDQET